MLKRAHKELRKQAYDVASESESSDSDASDSGTSRIVYPYKRDLSALDASDSSDTDNDDERDEESDEESGSDAASDAELGDGSVDIAPTAQEFKCKFCTDLVLSTKAQLVDHLASKKHQRRLRQLKNERTSKRELSEETKQKLEERKKARIDKAKSRIRERRKLTKRRRWEREQAAKATTQGDNAVTSEPTAKLESINTSEPAKGKKPKISDTKTPKKAKTSKKSKA